MTYLPLTDKAKEWISATLRPGENAVDATLGNGHDCLFLADLVGAGGRVYGFDVQPAAVEATRIRLGQAGLLERTVLIADGHQHLLNYLAGTPIAAVMFNLGYLPGGDKTVVTLSRTTRQALEGCATLLRKGGRISVLAYTGHPGGAEEADAVLAWAGLLDPHQWRTEVIEPGQSDHPPRLLCCERLA